MSDKLKEKLSFLHNEIDNLREIQRSISPSKLMAKTSRRSSKSPRPSMSAPQQLTVTHNSRPDIQTWPAPPPQNILGKIPHQKVPLTTSTGTSTSPIPESHFHVNTSLDDSRLLNMLMSASPNTGVRGRESELRRKIENLEQTLV